MAKPWRHHVKWNKPVTTGQILSDSTYIPLLRVVKDVETKNRIGVTMGWGKGDRELLFNGSRVSVWDDEKVLEMDGDDGCTIMWMYLIPLNCTLKYD